MSPCYKCEYRHPACHTHCKQYIEYQEKRVEKNKDNRLNNEADELLISAKHKRNENRYKKRRH